MAEAVWKLKQTDEDKVRALASELSVGPMLARLLVNRGLDSRDTAAAFLRSSLADLADPMLFADMEKAVERLTAAVENGEKIVIHGDYDADGITSTAFCRRILEDLGAKVDCFLPGRLEDGYGLRRKGVDFALQAGGRVLLTVDCGVTAVDEIAYARQRGLDVVVTDHHLPGESLPPANAVVDPNRADCRYPYKALAGVGVAYHLARALCGRLARGEPEKYLDLVALGTVADVMPLVAENRALVKAGLPLIEKGGNPGLAGLKKVAGMRGGEVKAGQLAFVLGPRLNAAGRMGNVDEALELLLAEDEQVCDKLARSLNEVNRRRQREERQAVKKAEDKVEEDTGLKARSVLVLADAEWHLGIIGLVASRMAQKYCRPVLVIKQDGDVGRGSARSVEGVDIHRMLEECAGLLLTYGGHKAAAGFELEMDKLEPLAEKMDALVGPDLPPEKRRPYLCAEAKIELAEITPGLMEGLSLLEPYGVGNPRPQLLLADLSVGSGQARVVGSEHLRLSLRGGGTELKAIAFGFGKMIDAMGREPVHLLGWPEYNEWQGHREIQFHVKDIKIGKLDLGEA